MKDRLVEIISNWMTPSKEDKFISALADTIIKFIEEEKKKPFICKCCSGSTVKLIDDDLFQCPRCGGLILRGYVKMDDIEVCPECDRGHIKKIVGNMNVIENTYSLSICPTCKGKGIVAKGEKE